MLRLLIAIGLGILGGGVVVMVVGPPGAGVWALLVGLTLTIVASVLVSIGRSTRGMAGPTEAQLAEAIAAGRIGLARVDAVRETGLRINEQPVCDLDITVATLTDSPFATTTRRLLTTVEVPRFQPGTEHRVALSPSGAVALSDAIPADVDGLRLPAPGDAPRRNLEDGATTGFGPRPLLGIGRGGRPWRVLLYVAAFAAAAILVVLPYRPALEQTLDAIPEGRLHADLREPASLTAALDALADAMGHDTVSSVVVMDDMVIVEAPLTPGEVATDS
ncbi:MAG: hypothetical protein ACK5IM_01465, partial [Demequina sp.]|uniref:hypothetical protein n=1 Tax=Demequina sp. TaxID=2050685 RepID=UPI003A89A1B8